MSTQQNEIAIFFTGGTIGMSADPKTGGVAPGGHFQKILGELETRHPGLALRPIPWSDKPSGHMTPEDMFALAKDVDAALGLENTLGAVVLHGTDTLVETAFMLDLACGSNKPVVCTGAMRYYSETGYDGLRNLLNSLRTVLLPLPREMGVVLLMTDRLFAARDVVKVNSLNIDAFESREAGIVGFVAGEEVILTHPCGFSARSPLPLRRLETAVPLLTCYTGMDGAGIDSALSSGAKGIVLEGFGAGNIPPGVIDAVRNCIRASVPVVIASRCAEGGVWPIYSYPGGAAYLKDMGAILCGRLGGPKARLLLMAALTLTADPAGLATYFE